MSSALKDMYSPLFYRNFSAVVKSIQRDFDEKSFINKIFDHEWKKRELKDRMRHTSTVLHEFFPEDFSESAELIKRIISVLRKQPITKSNFEFMFFPDYIEQFGMEQYEDSVGAMEFVTQFISCEFAVRPFIVKYSDKMLKQMLQWSSHKNHHVRRLASEGSRPRLPWAMALPALKKDPAPVLPILHNLKQDESEYVRRSVANNLNDIAKDNPHIVLKVAKQWKGISKETDAIIKHGSRTLLKQGHPEILKFYGLNNNEALKVSSFKVLTPVVKMGAQLVFSFSLQNSGKKEKTVRLEHGMYYRKQNGQLSKKVFKISERQIGAGERLDIVKKQSFRPITTRVYYTGGHKVSVIVNGEEMKTGEFVLKP